MLHLRLEIGRPALDERADAADQALRRLDLFQREFAGNGLDPAHTARDAGLGGNLEQADVAGPLDVRAAAQFRRELADLEHADAVAVLFAEQRHRAAVDRLVVGHLRRVGRRVAADLLVDPLLDLPQLSA